MTNEHGGGPLAGAVVIDCADSVAGAFATRLLADLGARVLIVEPPGGGRLRALGPFPGDSPDLERGGLHLALNAGKESVALDLNQQEGRRRFCALAGASELLFVSGDPDELRERGLDYAALAAEQLSLVYVSHSPFGHDGPYAGRASSEIVDYAMGGFMYFCGEPGRAPLMIPGFQGELHAGMQMATGGLIALRHARRTGTGQHVEVSTFEALLNAHVWLASSWLEEGELWRREGSGLVPCRDGFLMLGRVSPDLFLLIGRPELMDDPRFATTTGWRAALPEVRSMLAEWAADKAMEDVYNLAQSMRIIITPVNTVEQLASSAQLEARGWWRTVDTASDGTIAVPGPPWTLSGSVSGPRRGPPRLDEHEALPARREPLPRDPAAAQRQPLEGLRVLEATNAWAGPLAGRHLADMGADVVVVERPIIQPTRAQHFAGPTQRWPRFHDRGGAYNLLNRNKQAAMLDLQNPAGCEAFLRMVEWADVVIENNSPRVFSNLGLTYEALAERNPRVILCSLSAFGSSGPEANYAAYGSNIEGSSGLVAQTGYAPGELYATGTFHADPVGGTIGAGLIVAALEERERTGRGQHIEISLHEGSALFVLDSIMDHRLNGRVAGPMNNRSPRRAPQGAYPSAGEDCWLALACDDDAQWRALCDAIERPELAERHATLAERSGAHDEIDAAITEWSRQLDHQEATRLLQAVGVPAGPVLANWEIVSDPHLYERGYWVEVVHPEVGYQRWEGYPWRLSLTPGRTHSPAPRLGQHNDEVLRRATGMDDRDIRALRQAGALVDDPIDLDLYDLPRARR